MARSAESRNPLLPWLLLVGLAGAGAWLGFGRGSGKGAAADLGGVAAPEDGAQGRAAPGAPELDGSLEPAALLEGRVVHDGRPAEHFRIHAADRRSGLWRAWSFGPQAQGRFRIEGASAGEVWLHAEVPGAGFSARVQALLPADEPLVLEVGPGVRGRGRVVDLESGRPVAGARIDWLLGRLDLPIARGESGVRSDAEGRFEIGGLHPDSVGLAISAPGYREGELLAPPGDGPVRELGLARLERSAPLALRLLGAAEPEGFRLAAGFQVGGGGQAFDRGGQLDLPLERETRFVTLRWPQGFEDTYFVEPGEQSLVLEVEPQRAIELRALGAVPQDPGPALGVLLKWIDRRGRSVRRWASIEASGEPLRLPGILAERVDAEWTHGRAPGRSLSSFELGREPLARLDLPLGGGGWLVRVVDASGQPLAGIEAVLHQRLGGAVRRGFDAGPSDLAGLLELPRPLAGQAFLTLLDGRGGVLPERLLRDGDFGLEPPELRFAPTGRVELDLRLLGQPLAEVTVRWECAAGNVLLAPCWSDAGGRLLRQGLGPGRYLLLFEHPRLWPSRLEFELDGQHTGALELTGAVPLDLPVAERLPGLDPQAPLALELLEPLPETTLLAWPPAALALDADGHLRLPRAPTGRLRLRAGAESFEFEHR